MRMSAATLVLVIWSVVGSVFLSQFSPVASIKEVCVLLVWDDRARAVYAQQSKVIILLSSILFCLQPEQ